MTYSTDRAPISKVEAVKISDTKEQILIDGEVYLKAVKIGRWNYVPELIVADKETGEPRNYSYGKSATEEAAENWTPHPMRHEIALSYGGRRSENTDEQIERFKADYPNWQKERRRTRFGGTVEQLVAPINFTRRVHEIKRDY